MSSEQIRVCIGGGAGFIGSHMGIFLRKKGYWVRCVDWAKNEFMKPEERDEFYSHHNLKTTETYMSIARHSKGITKIKYMLCAGLQNEALQLLEKQAQEILSQKVFNFNKLREITETIEKLTIYTPFSVAVSFYVALYKAFWLGFTAIIPELAKRLCELININNFESFKTRIDEIGFITNLCSNKKSSNSIRLRNKHQTKRRHLSFEGGRTVSSLSSSVKTIDVSSESISLCHTREMCGMFYLEDGTTYLSMNEALMWFNVTPFSPLTTHAKFCP